jgi:ATP-dependent Clp protease ATP-binding subunit ClpA
MVRIDMSDNRRAHGLAQIGAPPGACRLRRSGQFHRSRPTPVVAVVLFDEIEKAHPEVLNVRFLQLLDDAG